MKPNTFIIILGIMLIVSCNRKDEEKIIIQDFTNSKIIKVYPYENYPYSMFNIWVKGYTNDTITIKLDSENSKAIMKLSGEINERWYTDYYGGGARKVIFEPYKATNGRLEIKVKL